MGEALRLGRTNRRGKTRTLGTNSKERAMKEVVCKVVLYHGGERETSTHYVLGIDEARKLSATAEHAEIYSPTNILIQ